MLKIIIPESLAEKPPPPWDSDIGVGCWTSSVNCFTSVIWVRSSEGVTLTSFGLPQQASFKGFYMYTSDFVWNKVKMP